MLHDLLVLDLKDGARVVLQLAPQFAPVHVANIKLLARSGWWDKAAIYRVQSVGKVRMSVHAEPHEGLGLASYAWMSSPLRRCRETAGVRRCAERAGVRDDVQRLPDRRDEWHPASYHSGRGRLAPERPPRACVSRPRR